LLECKLPKELTTLYRDIYASYISRVYEPRDTYHVTM